MSENIRVVKVRAYDAEGDGFNVEQRMIYSDKKVPNDAMLKCTPPSIA